MKQHTSIKRGFTIIEVVMVVAVIGVLASLTVIGWRSWQQTTTKNQVQTDIKQAAIAMESAKNFTESGYPTALPSSFSAKSGVTVSYVGGNGTAFCIQAQSTKDTSVNYYIDSSQSKEPQVGTCSSSPNFILAAPSPSTSSVTSSSFIVSWANVANATGYTVRYGTASPTTVASCTSSPCTISGLSGSTLYRVNVTATNSFTSTASSTLNVTTLASIAAPSAPSVSYTSAPAGTGKRNYYITATGGTCAGGTTTEWKIVVTETQEGQAIDPPDWGSVSWQTANTKTYVQITNGFQGPGAVTVYAKPRCTNGSQSTEYSSYATYPTD